MKVNGIELTAHSHPEIYKSALGHFEWTLKKMQEKVEHFNRLIDFLEEGGFKMGKDLVGRGDYLRTINEVNRPKITEDYGFSFEVFFPNKDNVVVDFDAFPCVWNTNRPSDLKLYVSGITMDKDAIGTYCAKLRLFQVDFRYDYKAWRGGYDYTKVVSDSLNGNERGVKASTMFKKLGESIESVKHGIECANKSQSVISSLIEEYKEKYPTARVYSEELYSRSGGRMRSRGKGIRIEFLNGSYIEISVSTSGEQRMFRYLDKRVNKLELSDLCNHLSK